MNSGLYTSLLCKYMKCMKGAFKQFGSGRNVLSSCLWFQERLTVVSESISRDSGLKASVSGFVSFSCNNDIVADCAASGAPTNLCFFASVTCSWFSTLLKGTCVQWLNQQPLQEKSLYHLCHRRRQISYDHQSWPRMCTYTCRQYNQIKN